MKEAKDRLRFDPAYREQRRRTINLRRNYFFQYPINLDHPIKAACAWLLPWDARRYPGIRRGISQLVGGRIKPSSVQNWRMTNKVPAWGAERLAREVGDKARLGLQIEAALLRMNAERRTPKPRGLQIIDDATGLPKYRNRVGARRKEDREV
jgi:hypothetical protein